jgi:hypothetical protein
MALVVPGFGKLVKQKRKARTGIDGLPVCLKVKAIRSPFIFIGFRLAQGI